MSTSMRRFGAAVLAGLFLLGVSRPATAVAPYVLPSAPVIPPNPNFQIAPGLSLTQAAYNTAVIGRAVSQISPYALGYNPYAPAVVAQCPAMPSHMTPLGGYGWPTLSACPGLAGTGAYPWSATLTTNPLTGGHDLRTAAPGYPYPTYGDDPLAGFMRGSADVINATGNYYKNVQCAWIIQAQADKARDNYRRTLLNEGSHCYEPMLTSEQLRQKQLERDLARGPYRPPIDLILSGKSLNDLLQRLQTDPNRAKGPNIPVDDKVLSHINVTSPKQPTAGVGLLKNDGKLAWPSVLAAKEFEQPRTDLTRKLADAAGDLKVGRAPEEGKVNDLKADADQMRKLMEKLDLSPSDYIAARSYLDQVNATILALKDPKAAAYFNHKFDAKNVAELVDNMRTEGLAFAPAAPGDEEAYKVLYQGLAAYDKALQQPVSPTPPKQP